MKSRSAGVCCIPSKDAEVCTCQADDVIDVISKKWALLIIRATGRLGKAGYNDLLKILRGISPSTLAQRLRELEKAGFLSRKIVDEGPIRVEYSLTHEGQEFSKAVAPMLNWASKRQSKTLVRLG